MTISTLLIFLVSLWTLVGIADHMLRLGIERELGKQQLSTTEVVAVDLEAEFADRFIALEAAAAAITPAIMQDSAALQNFLEARVALPTMFNSGLWVINAKGIGIADVPLATGRIGVDYSDRAYTRGALAGRTTVGEPVMGRMLNAPAFAIASPIFDHQGQVMGALLGAINLGKANFLSRVTDRRYGKTGGYLLIAREYRLIVTATDKTRIMEKLPEPGVHPFIDKVLAGYEGSGITISPRGMEVLVSIQNIAHANWYVATLLPTDEAFAPIHQVTKNIMFVALLLTLLAGLLTAWILHRQLAPMKTAVKILAGLPDEELLSHPLPVVRRDEIGELLSGFNHLLEKLKQRDQALRASEEAYRTVANFTYDWEYWLTPDGQMPYVSPSCEKHCGYSAAEFRSDPRLLERIIHPDDRAQLLGHLPDSLDKAHAATRHEIDLRIITRSGEERWFSHVCQPVYDSAGNYLGQRASNRDISDRIQAERERHKLEQQLRQTQKLESLGVLAGGIAHDFNNLLMAIMGNTELASKKLGSNSAAALHLDRISQTARRAADLSRQMLAYSGKGKFIVEQVDICRLIEEMVNMLEVSISKKAQLKFHLPPNLPAVEADSTQLRQIVMNLVINASEAIGEATGSITISCGAQQCDRAYLDRIWPQDRLEAGNYVYVGVADTGCGMTRETREKLFDPFFTTKFTGRGLGMAAVLGIVRGHKGAIKVESEPGHGSQFTIFLPAAPQRQESVVAPCVSDSWQGKGRVLLVDDEENVRTVCGEMLEELGFSVILAADGIQALEICRTDSEIDIVVLDMTMPRMDGEECYRHLCQLRPDLKIYISSGFAEQEVAQRFRDCPLAGIIPKPYHFSLLQKALQGQG
jgi:PAS domain S-box-containing protein